MSTRFFISNHVAMDLKVNYYMSTRFFISNHVAMDLKVKQLANQPTMMKILTQNGLVGHNCFWHNIIMYDSIYEILVAIKKC